METKKQKLYLIAQLASYMEEGYSLSVWAHAPSKTSPDCIVIAEFDADVPVPAKEEIIAKCFPQLNKMRKRVDAEAGAKKTEIDRLQSKLLGLVHIPGEKDQHEPEAEDAVIIDFDDGIPF